MGVDIFYFADHDLPINSVNDFLREFSKRIGAEVRCANMSKSKDSYLKLTADSSSFEHETIAGELFDNIISLSDILHRNRNFKNPCPVFTNNDIPYLSENGTKDMPLIMLDL